MAASPAKEHPVVLRVAKLKNLGHAVASARHTWREAEVPNAKAEFTHLNQDWRPAKSSGQLAAAIRERHKRVTEKPPADAVACLEYLVTANQDAFSVNGGHVDWYAYFSDAVAWLEAKHGKDNVVAVNIQLDEQAPHMVAYVVPLVEKSETTRIREVRAPGINPLDGKPNRVKKEYKVPPVTRLSAQTYAGGGAKLSRMQTEFADEVGKKHGLIRGIEKSRAQHQDVKSYYTRAKAFDESMPELVQEAMETALKPRLDAIKAKEEELKAHEYRLAGRARVLDDRQKVLDDFQHELNERDDRLRQWQADLYDYALHNGIEQDPPALDDDHRP